MGRLLTLKALKNAADDILMFYFYLSKKISIDFSCLAEDSLKNNETIFMNVVYCSRDWRFKGK